MHELVDKKLERRRKMTNVRSENRLGSRDDLNGKHENARFSPGTSPRNRKGMCWLYMKLLIMLVTHGCSPASSVDPSSAASSRGHSLNRTMVATVNPKPAATSTRDWVLDCEICHQGGINVVSGTIVLDNQPLTAT